MSDTIVNEDVVLLDRLTGLLWRGFPTVFHPQPGEIVVCRQNNSDNLFVKRIIATPSETIRIEQGVVYVQGVPLAERYALPTAGHNYASDFWPLDPGMPGQRAITLKQGTYFLLGDNRSVSLDSRTWGPVGLGDIIGPVRAIVHKRGGVVIAKVDPRWSSLQ